MAKESDLVLEVKNLKTVFFTHSGLFKAVDDISFTVKRGETLAIVGESGSGKSVTALSLMRLVPDPPGRIVSGSIRLEGEDIISLPEREMRSLRGSKMSMVFQDPFSSLNPTMTLGEQVSEAIRAHSRVPRREARDRALELFRSVRMPSPELRLRQYPHQISGGQGQPGMNARAVPTDPRP